MDIITYLNQRLKDSKDKGEIINWVKDYRRYGIYLTIDDSGFICKKLEAIINKANESYTKLEPITLFRRACN